VFRDPWKVDPAPWASRGVAKGIRHQTHGEFWLNLASPPTPGIFVSVASKGFSPTVSLLFATLAGKAISVAAKGLTRTMCW